MMLLIILMAILGFCISLYTYIIEQKIKKEPEFKPVCDISDKISCTKPMKSPYANLFFFSNALVGMLFYGLVVLLALLDAQKLMLIASIAGCLVSCVLAYFLYIKIKAVCLLCTALYIINFVLLYLSVGWMK